jgi:mannose-6-phosphate isomerase-like protein (cupin superfamily)
MSAMMSKRFDAPDELRTPPMANVAIVDLDGTKVARFSLEPGWRWSDSIKPIVGTDTCQVHHLGVLVAGRMHVVAADGSEAEVGPGACYVIEPGHDAWVVGDEPLVAYEFDARAAATYATPSG